MGFIASDYETFARECVESARKARDPELRNHFLELAHMWTNAAARMKGTEATAEPPLEKAR